MDKQAALVLFTAQLPETGAVPYEDVYNVMQATPEDRQAIEKFHSLRRDKDVPFYAKTVKVDGVRKLVVSRQPFAEEVEA